jgi:hypothetical protein
MKRTLLATSIVAVLVAGAINTASATEVGYGRKFGLGIELGDPTGIVGKLWLSNVNALDFGFGFQHYGWGRCYYDNVNIRRCGYQDYSFNADYLWQSNIVRGPAQLDWHVGVGGRVYFLGEPSNTRNRDFDIAARVPIGLDLMFNTPAFLEVFFEMVPALYLLPLDFGIEGGLGVRFYF